MNKIRFAIIAIVAVIASAMSSHISAQAFNFTPQQKKEVLADIRKELPVAMDEGTSWTGISIDDKTDTVILDWDIDPTKLGVTTAELRSEFRKFTTDQWIEMLGPEFFATMGSLAKNTQINVHFPDKIDIRRKFTN